MRREHVEHWVEQKLRKWKDQIGGKSDDSQDDEKITVWYGDIRGEQDIYQDHVILIKQLDNCQEQIKKKRRDGKLGGFKTF